MNEELTPSDFDGFQTYAQCRDAEIGRLQRINVSLVAQERGFREEIERLKALLVRAADALENGGWIQLNHGRIVQEMNWKVLIAELRKAAK